MAHRVPGSIVVAEAISLYLEMEALERRLQIAAQSIEAFRLSLQFVETRYERGLTSVLDVRQARRVLAQAETLVPQFEQEMGIILQQLSVLRGRYPQTRPARRQPEAHGPGARHQSEHPLPQDRGSENRDTGGGRQVSGEIT